MEIVWYLTVAIFLILGLAGCFISILPGPILSYLALLCLIPTDKCLSAATLLFFGVLTIIVTVADFIIPAIGAKKFNCSPYGTWGCVLGTFIGAFFFPIGLIVGPFLGAFLGIRLCEGVVFGLRTLRLEVFVLSKHLRFQDSG